MRHSAWAAPTLLLAAGLTSCAKPPAPPPEPVAPPITADGRYRGTARLTRASSNGCPRSGARVIEVDNGTVTLSYRVTPRRLVQLTATAQADGTLHAEDGTGQLDGFVRDGRLEVVVSSPMCENRWTLTKVD